MILIMIRRVYKKGDNKMRLIDADELKAEIEKIVEEERKEDPMWANGLRYALTIINKAQTVEKR